MDLRHISEEYSNIGNELIQTEDALSDIRNSEVSIVYLGSEQEKKSQGRLIFGQCEKVPDRYKWAVPCDFTITVFEPNTERFTDEQLRILILHELMHIGIEFDGNEEKYFVRPHDIEDFQEILERFGMDWNT
jgi:hypothetical protein